ncbi:MAG: DUF4325 domain-containing protein [Erysipelotrichaceae bacterium]|nr:DUF4325 domain-containing protein [Erysipelotrichaceae bacterium]
MREINIARDFTKTPGGRFKKEGKHSGQEFRDTILIPEYEKAVENNEVLRVNLDGGYGYGSSFLEESFGGLVRKFGKVDADKIEIVSEEEPQLVNDIKQYIADENRRIEGENR